MIHCNERRPETLGVRDLLTKLNCRRQKVILNIAGRDNSLHCRELLEHTLQTADAMRAAILLPRITNDSCERVSRGAIV